mmetsp:Transcript_8070/g.26459  ORF Transcript_8070/g.26459 Transcript_8070/m.26459 type:complete len:226 (-) Transcript_8070:729-1406(-)
MVAKRHTLPLGSASLRAEDAFHVVADQSAPALYVAFSRYATAGRCLDHVARLLERGASPDGLERGASPEGLELVAVSADGAARVLPSSSTLAQLEDDGVLRQFDVVRTRPKGHTAQPSLVEAPPSSDADRAADAAADEATPPADEPTSAALGDFPLTVKWQNKNHDLAGLRDDSTVSDLRRAVFAATGVDPKRQKLVASGLAHDGTLLRETKLKRNAVVILMQTR